MMAAVCSVATEPLAIAGRGRAVLCKGDLFAFRPKYEVIS